MLCSGTETLPEGSELARRLAGVTTTQKLTLFQDGERLTLPPVASCWCDKQG